MDRTRRLSSEELLQKFSARLEILEKYAAIYDDGFVAISLPMATELYVLLAGSSEATKLRAEMRFTSPDVRDESRMLNALYKLVGVQSGGNPPTVEFMPVFRNPQMEKLKSLRFVEWWNRDVIFRQSAAPPGTPPGLIPVNGAPSVPFEEREKLTRRELVTLVRNKLAAHQDLELPQLLDELDNANSYCSLQVNWNGQMLSTDDGSLPVKVSPLPAMVRQISHEVLTAYGRA